MAMGKVTNSNDDCHYHAQAVAVAKTATVRSCVSAPSTSSHRGWGHRRRRSRSHRCHFRLFRFLLALSFVVLLQSSKLMLIELSTNPSPLLLLTVSVKLPSLPSVVLAEESRSTAGEDVLGRSHRKKERKRSKTENDDKKRFDGRGHLMQGQRLFQLGNYNRAAFHFWQAVLLHSNKNIDKNNNNGSTRKSNEQYSVDEAFTPFLQCYHIQHKLVDGFVFIAAEGFARGQVDMGKMYLEQALERNGEHDAALRLKDLSTAFDGGFHASNVDVVGLTNRLLEIRNEVDISGIIVSDEDVDPDSSFDDDSGNNKSRSRSIGSSRHDDEETNRSHHDPYGNQSAKPKINPENFTPTLFRKSPEEIYNIGTHYFNTKNLVQAAQIFELSCQKSDYKLSVACTNAAYIRTNLCDWGYLGRGFERDMKIVELVTQREAELYRSVQYSDDLDEDYYSIYGHDSNDEERIRALQTMRAAGISYSNDYRQQYPGIIHWKRSTSVHPHMMLGYPLDNSKSILKRYVSESTAGMDELRARLQDDGTIADRPTDLPYSVAEMRETFAKKSEEHQLRHEEDGTPLPPIKVGFVASGFNSKAVLFLSHDLFRFFDPDIVEIHIFSTGSPDHPQFIQQTMRGVDWRQRVIDSVDYFHDVRDFNGDHISLARFIHEKEIQILIEWDGYARQGERAMGLMALRPCPVQILHQEFLGTSGAQYIDYIVTDKVVSPIRLEGLYTEKFLYLPHHFFSKGHAVQKEVVPPALEYVPKDSSLSAFRLGVGSPQENACLSSNPLGTSDANGEVSFVYCNFNKFLKNNPETMRSWIHILQNVPNSILCLLENPTEGIPNLRKFVNEVTAEESYGGDNYGHDSTTLNINTRIHFIPWEKNPFDHQQRSHSLCNAMLDSHPYNGHTTAQDALYAGVPIVTRSDGDDMASRVTTSSNVILGLEELNAYNGIEEYEKIAIRLGKDKDFFQSVRTKLIESCLQTNPMHPYWDVPRYVKNFERGLMMVWENFLMGEDMDHVEVQDNEGFTGGTMVNDLVRRENKRKEVKKIRKLVVLDDYNINNDEGEL
ncbi:hypothetical protein ACHAXS_012624 [Conticribra weissflogii]